MLNTLLTGGLAISMTTGSSHWKVLFGRNGVKNLFEFAKEGYVYTMRSSRFIHPIVPVHPLCALSRKRV